MSVESYRTQPGVEERELTEKGLRTGLGLEES